MQGDPKIYLAPNFSLVGIGEVLFDLFHALAYTLSPDD